ncbi:1175_t:CDS:1 [Diversispora eburnea]|uniref:1175_t:CDS:1 n=1 Tax=Diversispora eburnea TaxID=1213867 RepID=A0A9N9GEI3_9GLOM|nr:1175_t:CDS:1 [Diversispora eburnea]
MALALPELLAKIFNFLAEDNALYPVLFVSRLWSMCSGSILWRRIELLGNGDAFGEKYEIQLKKFMGFLDRETKPVYASNTRYLKINHYYELSNKVIKKIIESFPNITHLDFKRTCGFDDAALIKISRAYPNLIHLNVSNNCELTDNSIIELARRCPKLQNLEISWGGDITDRSIYGITRSCHDLKHIGISGGRNCITDKSIREITRFNPNIQSLNFNYCKKLTDSTIYTLVDSYPDLRKLNLSDCEEISNIGIRQIARCHNLEHLALNSLGFLNDETICIIVQSCLNIRYLNLEFCNVTDTAVEAVTRSCRNIEYLNLYGSESITDKSISKLAKMCSKIRDLELGFCKLITDIAIKDIAHNLSDLKYLGLKYCIKISKEALDTLNPDLDIGGYCFADTVYTIPSTL